MIEQTGYDDENEEGRVFSRRYREARRAGLSIVEARLFAESDADVRDLRRLVERGCPLELLPKILL